MRATPVILGFDGLEISGIWQSTAAMTHKVTKKGDPAPPGGDVTFALGLYLKKINFDEIVKSCIGDIGLSLAWLNSLKASRFLLVCVCVCVIVIVIVK